LTVRVHSRAAGFDNAGPSFTQSGEKSWSALYCPVPVRLAFAGRAVFGSNRSGTHIYMCGNPGLTRLLLALSD